MKIKMIFDSSVGLTEKEIKKLGAGFVPLVITINGREYKDGIDITQEDLVRMMDTNTEIATAAATLGDLNAAFEEGLKEADHVVYLPLTKNLSSSYNNAVLLAKEEKFKDKVTVIDSIYITPWTHTHAKKIIEKSKEGKLEELLVYINWFQKDVIGFIVPETMIFLKNGGRISKAQYIIGSLAKVNPVIAAYLGSIKDETHGIKALKGKGVMGATKKGMHALLGDWKKKYLDSEAEYIPAFLATGKHRDEFKEFITEEFEKAGWDTSELIETKMGGAIIAHTGPNIYLAAFIKKEKE